MNGTTLWESNVAMENRPFCGVFYVFSIATFDYQRLLNFRSFFGVQQISHVWLTINPQCKFKSSGRRPHMWVS